MTLKDYVSYTPCAAGSVEPPAREKWVVRLSGISLSSKRLLSRQIIGVHTLNAAPGGAFAARLVSAEGIESPLECSFNNIERNGRQF